MVDVFLYAGEANAADVRLRDPTTAPVARGVPFAAYDVVLQAARTTAGLQAITGACGGARPVAVEVWTTRAQTLELATSGACLSVGFADMLSQRVAVGMAQNGQAFGSARTGRRFDSGKLVQLCAATSEAVLGEASRHSLSENTLVLEWTTPPTTPIQLLVVFYFGTGILAKVGEYAGAVGIGGTAVVTGLGFKPRVVKLASALNPFSIGGSNAASDRLAYGVATVADDGTFQQLSVATMNRNNGGASATACGSALSSQRILQRISTDTTGTTITLECEHEFTAVSSDGFTITNRVGTFNLTGAYLALYTGSLRAWAGEPALAVSAAGVKSVTTPGWKPGALFSWATGQTVDNDQTATNQASHLSLGAAASPARQGSVAYQVRDNVATSATRSAASAKLVLELSDTGGVLYSALLDSFTASGFDVNVDGAGASDFLAVMLALEAGDKELPSAVPLALVLPAPTILSTETPAAVPVALALPAPARLLTATPSPTLLALALSAPTRLLAETPSAVLLALNLPAPARLLTETPAPTLLALALPAPARLETETPSAVLLALNVPSPTRLLTETPGAAVLAFALPAPARLLAETPASAVLHLALPAPTLDLPGASRELPAPVALHLAVPAVLRGTTSTPSTVALPLVVPAVVRALALAPAPVALELRLGVPVVMRFQARLDLELEVARTVDVPAELSRALAVQLELARRVDLDAVVE